MKEIEVKFRIADRLRAENALEQANIKLSDEIIQDDTAYAPKDWKADQDATGVPFLRIRKQGNKAILTLKKPVDNLLDRIEHETPVDDPAEAAKIIKELGFIEHAHVIKRRRKAKLGAYEICVDAVEELGDFVEIEKLVEDDADGEAVQAEIRDYLTNIIGPENLLSEVHKGYDILMRELKST